MTLFASVAPEESIFQAALDKYFGGEADPKTLALLGEWRSTSASNGKGNPGMNGFWLTGYSSKRENRDGWMILLPFVRNWP
jgi:hypothetical protein